MLKGLFKKTPTIDESRKICFKALWESDEIKQISKAIKDLKFTGKDKLDGVEYYQYWVSEEHNQLYIAYCRDIRTPNEVMWKGLS